MFEIAWYIIFSAFVLDFILGDPGWLPHPIVGMGNAISFFEGKFRKPFKKNQANRMIFSGLVFALFLIGSTWLISFCLVKIFTLIHPLLGLGVQALLLFYCFSAKSLVQAAHEVSLPLGAQDIETARKKVAMIVGRQTHTLDEAAVTRATVETVAENFVDGFLSPLFFALLFGVPGALAYKMINTLDSMVGYKNETYMFFGRASARIDDAANFIPARISVGMISFSAFLLSTRKGIQAFKTGLSQGNHHKSPNAGYPEAAFAGALEICMGGPNIYHGKLVEKPYIGKEFTNPDIHGIKRACELMMLSSLISTLAACLLLLVLSA
ncbi:MAG: cobalamin biosynthesis protein CobD [Desulfobacula sp.]|nr:cobalamin biosynthesis protein CobD [Desulfobacula sp.]